MKKLRSFSSLLAVGLLALSASPAKASNNAADDSSLYSQPWTDGSNQGFGFNPWIFDGAVGTSGGYGQFIGLSGLSSSSFGTYSYPADSGSYAGAARDFTGGPLLAGQAFSISLGYNAIAANGLIGLDFRDSGGATVFPCSVMGPANGN